MAEDIRIVLTRIQTHARQLERNHTQVDEMMLLMIQDGLGAMRYGQYGGSFPDPTSRAAFTSRTVVDADGNQRDVVVWRDHRPEDDYRRYHELAEIADKVFEEWDTIRQRYMSANNNIRDRLDPTDWCVVHWHLQIYEGHRRTRGNLCKICAAFYDENKREPTSTEADHFHRHGRWPHRLFDPKERKAV